MSDVPVKNWFTEFPVSQITERSAPVPVIEGRAKTFTERLKYRLITITPRAKIFYTLDGSVPNERSNEYQDAFWIDKTTTVKAFAVNVKAAKKARLPKRNSYKMPNDWTVKILSKYNRQYTGGGDEGLIDGIRGTTEFRFGRMAGLSGSGFCRRD